MRCSISDGADRPAADAYTASSGASRSSLKRSSCCLHDRAGHAIDALDHAAHLRGIGQQRRRPRVEPRLGAWRDAESTARPIPAARPSEPSSTVTRRCVIAVPVRGVLTTSRSGGGASPVAIASSVAAARERIALHRVVHALGEERVAHRVGRLVERVQRESELRLRPRRAARGPASSRDRRRVPRPCRSAFHFRCSTRPSTTLLAAMASTAASRCRPRAESCFRRAARRCGRR